MNFLVMLSISIAMIDAEVVQFPPQDIMSWNGKLTFRA